MPKDTAKLKKHIALLAERLNKGAKLDLSGQMQNDIGFRTENKKQLETLNESQEESEDTTGLLVLSAWHLLIKIWGDSPACS